jgi:hypothetical protein
VKAHYGGAKNVVTLYSFLGVSMFELHMVILEHIFPNFFHNMVDYNTKNQLKRFFFPTSIVKFQNIFVTK